jgi:hypothetical protein
MPHKNRWRIIAFGWLFQRQQILIVGHLFLKERFKLGVCDGLSEYFWQIVLELINNRHRQIAAQAQRGEPSARHQRLDWLIQLQISIQVQ